MDGSAAALLARRLERARLVGYGRAGPPPGVDRAARASRLAADVGGRVVDTGEGELVVIESAVPMAIDRSAFDRLPYAVEPNRPFVCLDTETTGLATAAGTLPFLVGLGTWDGRVLRVRQLLLTDHAAEPAMLRTVAASVNAGAWLVTYNGRSFDWPLLVARYRLHRREPPLAAGHLDLLHVARGLWKHRLGSARLATVEQAICHVRRSDDLPGALIPERYFAYLRERRGELLRQVVDHNRQDVVSLARLLVTLARLAQPEAWQSAHPADVGALGRAYWRAGDSLTALACLEAALGARAWHEGVVGGAAVWRRLATDRARMLARLDRRHEAVAAWLAIGRRGGPGAAAAWLHVARHREHVEHDAAGALDACNQAIACAERARLWGRPAPAIERDLARRMARLRRRALRRPTIPSAQRAA